MENGFIGQQRIWSIKNAKLEREERRREVRWKIRILPKQISTQQFTAFDHDNGVGSAISSDKLSVVTPFSIRSTVQNSPHPG